MNGLDWAPSACTLPTVEQPLREREFAALFATSLRAAEQLSPTRAELALDSASEATARALAARESACCSFFAFEFTRRGAALMLSITVPEQHADVLTALVATARRDAKASNGDRPVRPLS